jgi:hypothetical protein
VTIILDCFEYSQHQLVEIASSFRMHSSSLDSTFPPLDSRLRGNDSHRNHNYFISDIIGDTIIGHRLEVEVWNIDI